MEDYFKDFAGTSLRCIQKLDYTWKFVFADGMEIATEGMWRLIKSEGIVVTSQDDQQQFGLAVEVDAAERIFSCLESVEVDSASLVPKTGDLNVLFREDGVLQFLQTSSAYESWRASTPQGGCVCLGGGEVTYL